MATGEPPGFREAVFMWLQEQMRATPVFTRQDLQRVPIAGQTVALIALQSGIWKPTGMDAALSISTGYYQNPKRRRYVDELGPDQLLRYKWQGENPEHADNRGLRLAMQRRLPLVWFVGVGYKPDTNTQVFEPVFPVWLIAEEPEHLQFVVALDEAQQGLVHEGLLKVSDIERRYNLAVTTRRLHQPLFRSRVLHAYGRRCAVCRLPFGELLDAAHIRPDSAGGTPTVPNGLSLCRIHHGAYDANILGITPDYRITVKDRVLATFDGPTLQHALKEVHGTKLAQLPTQRSDQPDRGLLEERYEAFRRAS